MFWPLMVQKWHQQKGYIDPDKIAAHIDEQEAYVAAERESSARDIDWQLTHI